MKRNEPKNIYLLGEKYESNFFWDRSQDKNQWNKESFKTAFLVLKAEK